MIQDWQRCAPTMALNVPIRQSTQVEKVVAPPSQLLMSCFPASHVVVVQGKQFNPVFELYVPLRQLPHTLSVVRVHACPLSPFSPCPIGQDSLHFLHNVSVVTSEYVLPLVQASQTRFAVRVQAVFKPEPVEQVEEQVLHSVRREAYSPLSHFLQAFSPELQPFE